MDISDFKLIGEWNDEAPEAIATLIARDALGRILFQLRDDVDGVLGRGLWSTFGGRIETGETPDECIVREIVEELGLKLQLDDLLHLARFMTATGKRVFVFEKQSPISAQQIRLGEGAGFAFLNREQILSFPIVASLSEYLRGVAADTKR